MQTQTIIDNELAPIPPKLNSGGSRRDVMQSLIPHLNAISAQDFLERDIPPRKMMLRPILPEQGMVMVHGVRGRGKTHIALAMGVAAASGKQFLRWEASVLSHKELALVLL